MQISLNEPFDIPSSTPQQRKIGGRNTHPTQGLRYARAAWQALLEKYKPAKPITGAVFLDVRLYYHKKSLKKCMEPKTTRPDGDNLLKIIKDAATKAGWWEDDAIVFWEAIARYNIQGADMVNIIAREEPNENLP